MKRTQLLSILLCSKLFSANAQLSEVRKFQLDSVVSVMPADIRKNLWAAHALMDSIGVNNEEKVWMFYGFFAANLKYDHERQWDKKAPELSPELTVQKGKAVCRDFSRVFSIMCSKSGITCMEVFGKTKVPFIPKMKSYFHLNFHPGLHAWNVVKVDSVWQLMDPTWSSVEQIEKVAYFDAQTKTKKYLKIKRAGRTYYNPDPGFMMESHAPDHPAQYLSEFVPTYKTVFKKSKKQDAYSSAYNYSVDLDSLMKFEFPLLSKALYSGSEKYSGENHLHYSYRYELAIPLLRPSRYQVFTSATYDEAEARINRINRFLDNNSFSFYSMYTDEFKKQLDKKRKALKKKEDEMKKYKR